jgi:TonB family protein
VLSKVAPWMVLTLWGVRARRMRITSCVIAIALLAISSAGVCQQIQPPSLTPFAAEDTPAAAFAREVFKALTKTRPSGAGLPGPSGMVRVKFVLSPEGQLKSAEVVASSGNSKLDEIALQAVRRTVFPSPPRDLTLDQLTFQTSYRFVLHR